MFVGAGDASATGALAMVAWPSVAHADDDQHNDSRGGGITGRYRTTATDDAGNLFFEDAGTFAGGRVHVEDL